MLKDSDFIFDYENATEKPNKGLYFVGAFVIDRQVVDINIYKNEFLDIYNSSDVSEKDSYGDKILISFVGKNSDSVVDIEMNDRLGSIILSNPTFVSIPEENSWVGIGSSYIDGQFVR